MKMYNKLLKGALILSIGSGVLIGCSAQDEQATQTSTTDTTGTQQEQQATTPVATEEETKESNEKEEKIELIFWHSMGGVGGEAIDSLTQQFNDSQDEIYVDAQYQGAYDDAINKLKSTMLGGDGPDIMQLYDIGTRWMIDSGYALPMQQLIDADGYDKSQLEENILAYYTVEDMLYSMPFNSSTPILYYNKDAFEEVGLDKEVGPANFDELIQYSEQLMIVEGDQVERYGFALRVYGWFFEQLIVKQQLDFADNGNGRLEPATSVLFDQNGAGEKVMSQYKALLDSGTAINFGRNGDTTTESFVSGRSAMMFQSTAALGGIKAGIDGSFELGTAYLPSVGTDDAGGVSIGGGSLWAIDKQDTKTQEAAWEFIKFMVSPEVQVQWSQATGYFPITKLAYDLPEMQTHLEENPEFKTAIDQLHDSTGSTGALLAVFPEARATVEENMEKMLNGESTPEEAVQEAADVINSAIDRYNRSNQ